MTRREVVNRVGALEIDLAIDAGLVTADADAIAWQVRDALADAVEAAMAASERQWGAMQVPHLEIDLGVHLGPPDWSALRRELQQRVEAALAAHRPADQATDFGAGEHRRAGDARVVAAEPDPAHVGASGPPFTARADITGERPADAAADFAALERLASAPAMALGALRRESPGLWHRLRGGLSPRAWRAVERLLAARSSLQPAEAVPGDGKVGAADVKRRRDLSRADAGVFGRPTQNGGTPTGVRPDDTDAGHAGRGSMPSHAGSAHDTPSAGMQAALAPSGAAPTDGSRVDVAAAAVARGELSALANAPVDTLAALLERLAPSPPDDPSAGLSRAVALAGVQAGDRRGVLLAALQTIAAGRPVDVSRLTDTVPAHASADGTARGAPIDDSAPGAGAARVEPGSSPGLPVAPSTARAADGNHAGAASPVAPLAGLAAARGRGAVGQEAASEAVVARADVGDVGAALTLSRDDPAALAALPVEMLMTLLERLAPASPNDPSSGLAKAVALAGARVGHRRSMLLAAVQAVAAGQPVDIERLADEAVRAALPEQAEAGSRPHDRRPAASGPGAGARARHAPLAAARMDPPLDHAVDGRPPDGLSRSATDGARAAVLVPDDSSTEGRIEGPARPEAGSVEFRAGALMAGLLDGPAPLRAAARLALVAAAIAHPGAIAAALADPDSGARRADVLCAALGDGGVRRLAAALRPGLDGATAEALEAFFDSLDDVTGAPDPAGRARFVLLVADGALPGAADLAALLLRAAAWIAGPGPDADTLAALAASRLPHVAGQSAGPARRAALALRAGGGAVAQPRRGAAVTRGMADARHVTGVAGLVIVSPFLPRLFSRLDLLDGGSFRDETARLRAMDAVTRLAFGAAEPPPSDRLFESLLCGGTPEDVIRPPMPLASGDAALADGLVEAVLQQWPGLGGTSPDGLRATFLRRDGMIREEAQALHLHVADGPFDMLLSRLPWPLDPVRHPWMPRPIRVRWRDTHG